MAKEKINIQIGDEIIELKGSELDAFIEQRKIDNDNYAEALLKHEKQKELKISAYKKLGLTDEEINAII